MAVLIEGYSVVVRNETIAGKYPGGADAYRREAPNATFCADDHLCRVGFMLLEDAEVFLAHLAANGLTPSRNEFAEDAALVSEREGPLCPGTWLSLGRLQGAPAAWLAAAPPGELQAPAGWTPCSLRYMSADEVKQRLEFLRSEGNVDVYRDKETGQEFYTGRTSITDQDRARHDELYEKACGLIQGLILLGDQAPAELDAESRRRLADAIGLFEQAIEIHPGNWAAMWLLGKIHQRLEEFDRGLHWFSRAHRVNPDHPDVAREASIAAMEAGRPEDAVHFCNRALEAKPDDAGLQANLALALLFTGKVEQARKAADQSLRRNPADKITAQISGIIEEVLTGVRPCPRHVRDL